MTGEHILVFETEIAIPFTVVNATAMEKGSLLTMTDLMTAGLTTTKEAVAAGVLVEEKIASDGRVKAPVYRHGIFRATASGSITVGDGLITSTGGVNKLEAAGTAVEDLVGVAFETASDGHTFLYELNPITVNQA